MWAVGVLAVVAGVGVLVNAHCYIDPSVINKSDRDQQENYLKILEPINGQRCAPVAWTKTGSHQLAKGTNGDKSPFVPGDFIELDVEIQQGFGIYGFDGNRGPMSGTFVSRAVDSHGTLGGCFTLSESAVAVFLGAIVSSLVQIKMLNDSQSTLMCTSTFIVRHRCVCSPSSEGLSGGAIFFILLLVAFLGYFVFGFFYLRLVKGAKGIEQIPNRPFWFRVGNMLADGCGAVFRCDRYCGGASTANSYSGYSPIDERLAQDLRDTDRDSTLLSP
nr:uncharacterized protein LOC123760890 [Procambarus clarkii]